MIQLEYMNGIGGDFFIFWEIGRAVLAGLGPYTVDLSCYPPTTSLIFTLFGLLPYYPAYIFWTALNTTLYMAALRKMKLGRTWWIWLLYTPFLFNLLTGQLDVVFFWLATHLSQSAKEPLKSRGLQPSEDKKKPIHFKLSSVWHAYWQPALAGALLTLKPQLAAVILPWYLLRWLSVERGILALWTGLTVVLHTLSLAYDLNIYSQWIGALNGVSEMKANVSAGIFAFQLIDIPIPVLAVIGLVTAVWGLTRREELSRPAQLIAFPLTIWYDGIILAGSGPGLWLVPLSWVAFLASGMVKNCLPLTVIPLAALATLIISPISVNKDQRGERVLQE